MSISGVRREPGPWWSCQILAWNLSDVSTHLYSDDYGDSTRCQIKRDFRQHHRSNEISSSKKACFNAKSRCVSPLFLMRVDVSAHASLSKIVVFFNRHVQSFFPLTMTIWRKLQARLSTFHICNMSRHFAQRCSARVHIHQSRPAAALQAHILIGASQSKSKAVMQILH